MNILEEKIKKAKSEYRLACIPFVTAGFPNKEKFWEILAELDEFGADIIEIGVPFSDPVADGPVVENASRRALEMGVNLKEIMLGLKERKGQFKSGLVLMGYLNPFMQYGFEKLAKDAAASGVHGFIIPDLPYEESQELVGILEKENLALVPLIGLNTSEERMKLYAEKNNGYVYVVSTMGTTGGKVSLSEALCKTMLSARSIFNTPIALGFGLKEPAQLEEIPKEALPDAVVFGSALLQHIDAGKSVKSFLAVWK